MLSEMVVLGVLIGLAATAMGLWALVLQVRANPRVPIPVVTGRLPVDPQRAKGLRAGATGIAVMAGVLAAPEIGMAAVWLAVPAIVLPLVTALAYNLWLRRGDPPIGRTAVARLRQLAVTRSAGGP